MGKVFLDFFEHSRCSRNKDTAIPKKGALLDKTLGCVYVGFLMKGCNSIYTILCICYLTCLYIPIPGFRSPWRNPYGNDTIPLQGLESACQYGLMKRFCILNIVICRQNDHNSILRIFLDEKGSNTDCRGGISPKGFCDDIFFRYMGNGAFDGICLEEGGYYLDPAGRYNGCNKFNCFFEKNLISGYIKELLRPVFFAPWPEPGATSSSHYNRI